MTLDEARNFISGLHKPETTKLVAAMEQAVSGAERRRLERTYDDLEKVRVAHNEAICHAEKCITIVNEIVHALWYNGHVLDVDKPVGGADFIQDVSCLLTNYGYHPEKPSAIDES